MNIFNISDSARLILMNDAIANNYGPVWDLIRKVPHYFSGYGEKPECLDLRLVEERSIYFINPLNNKILEIYYDEDHWVMQCNFTENKHCECNVLINSITEECLAALLPYSGWSINDYNDYLPF